MHAEEKSKLGYTERENKNLEIKIVPKEAYGKISLCVQKEQALIALIATIICSSWLAATGKELSLYDKKSGGLTNLCPFVRR